MKKILLALFCAFPLAANAADFTGANVWIGGQFIEGSLDWLDTEDNSSLNIGDSDTSFAIGADYGFALSPDLVVLAGLSWNDKASAGKFSDGTSGSTRINVESDPSYMIYLAPGIKINESSLLYGKVSYSKADGRLYGTDESGKAFDLKDNDKSVGYGIGIRSYFSDGLFVNAEVDRTEYSYAIETIKIDAPITRATISIGMTF